MAACSHDRAIVAGVEPIHQRAQSQRIVDDLAEILADAHFARSEFERSLLEAHVDQIIFKRLLVLRYWTDLPRATL